MVRIAPNCDIPNLSDIVEDGFDTVYSMFDNDDDSIYIIDDIETDMDVATDTIDA